MGCYSVSCGVSRLPIYAEKAVLIPLIPSKYGSNSFSGDGAQIVSNEGPRAIYDPLPPIFGTMDSYGTLENIEHDWNTEFLSNYYGTDIDSICNSIARGSMDRDAPLMFDGIPLNVGMYISRPIWDYMMKSRPEHKSTSMLDGNICRYEIIDSLLKYIGFEFVCKDSSINERFNLKYVRGNCEVWTDRTCIGRYTIDGMMQNHYVLYMQEFIKLFNCTPEQIKFFQNTKMSHYIMESVCGSSDISSPDCERILILEHLRKLRQRVWTFENDHIHDVYGPSLKNVEARKTFGDLNDMISGLWGTSTVLMPSLSGLQHGDLKFMKGFYETAMGYTQELMSEYDDY